MSTEDTKIITRNPNVFSVKVQDRLFSCNRVLFSNRSLYFEGHLKKEWTENTVNIDNNEVDAESFDICRQWIHTDYCFERVNAQNALNVLKCFNYLLCEDATDLCIIHIDNLLFHSDFNTEGLNDLMEMAEQLTRPKLKEIVFSYIVSNFNVVSQDEKFYEVISLDMLIKMFEQKIIGTENEDQLYAVAIRWLNHQPDRQENAKDLMSYILMEHIHKSTFLRFPEVNYAGIRSTIGASSVQCQSGSVLIDSNVPLVREYSLEQEVDDDYFPACKKIFTAVSSSGECCFFDPYAPVPKWKEGKLFDVASTGRILMTPYGLYQMCGQLLYKWEKHWFPLRHAFLINSTCPNLDYHKGYIYATDATAKEENESVFVERYNIEKQTWQQVAQIHLKELLSGIYEIKFSDNENFPDECYIHTCIAKECLVITVNSMYSNLRFPDMPLVHGVVTCAVDIRSGMQMNDETEPACGQMIDHSSSLRLFAAGDHVQMVANLAGATGVAKEPYVASLQMGDSGPIAWFPSDIGDNTVAPSNNFGCVYANGELYIVLGKYGHICRMGVPAKEPGGDYKVIIPTRWHDISKCPVDFTDFSFWYLPLSMMEHKQ